VKVKVMTKARVIKIGANRGKPRFWLEGTVLVEAGFVRGDKFNLTIEPGVMVIEKHREGKRTVSGHHDRPVIDIATADLLTVAPIGTGLLIKCTKPGKLTCKPVSLEVSNAA
jgi:DNA (cytosine-5)-methyltransferase 1